MYPSLVVPLYATWCVRIRVLAFDAYKKWMGLIFEAYMLLSDAACLCSMSLSSVVSLCHVIDVLVFVCRSEWKSHACVRACACVRVCVRVRMFVCLYVCVCLCMFMWVCCVCLCVRVRARVCCAYRHLTLSFRFCHRACLIPPLCAACQWCSERRWPLLSPTSPYATAFIIHRALLYHHHYYCCCLLLSSSELFFNFLIFTYFLAFAQKIPLSTFRFYRVQPPQVRGAAERWTALPTPQCPSATIPTTAQTPTNKKRPLDAATFFLQVNWNLLHSGQQDVLTDILLFSCCFVQIFLNVIP